MDMNGDGRAAFFYGTLMAPRILYRVLYDTSTPPAERTSHLTVTPALLHNYCRRRVVNADYPGIIPEEGKSVRGSFVTGLRALEMFRLDVFEGSAYDRQKVQVEVLEGPDKGKLVEVEAYVWTASEDELEKEEWDIEEFMREKMHRWADDSEEYAEVDASVEEGLDVVRKDETKVLGSAV